MEEHLQRYLPDSNHKLIKDYTATVVHYNDNPLKRLLTSIIILETL